MRAGVDCGAPSKFAFEAICRHAIRATLCLRGWGWSDADAVAAQIVAAALNQIGARRPTWKEGQPEWTQDGFAPIERTRCIRCRSLLEGAQTKYCSDLCASSHLQAINRVQRAMEDQAYDLVVSPGGARRYV